MNGDDTTGKVMTKVNATQVAPNGLQEGKPDPKWKRFYTVLGQFNTIAVREANEDLECATETLIKLTCLIDGRCSSFGPDYAWDEKAQKCVRVGDPVG